MKKNVLNKINRYKEIMGDHNRCQLKIAYDRCKIIYLTRPDFLLFFFASSHV